MNVWHNVLEKFSEGQRYYRNLYLIKDEVYGKDLDHVELEISIFEPVDVTVDDTYEIYFNLINSDPTFYGIVYAKENDFMQRHAKLKEELQKRVDSNKTVKNDGKYKLEGEFINSFVKKHEVKMPMDMFFDFDIEEMAKALSKLYDDVDDFF